MIYSPTRHVKVLSGEVQGELFRDLVLHSFKEGDRPVSSGRFFINHIAVGGEVPEKAGGFQPPAVTQTSVERSGRIGRRGDRRCAPAHGYAGAVAACVVSGDGGRSDA